MKWLPGQKNNTYKQSFEDKKGTVGKESTDAILKCRKCVTDPDEFGKKRSKGHSSRSSHSKSRSTHKKDGNKDVKPTSDHHEKLSSSKKDEGKVVNSKSSEISASKSSDVEKKVKTRALFPVKRVKSKLLYDDDDVPPTDTTINPENVEKSFYSTDKSKWSKKSVKSSDIEPKISSGEAAQSDDNIKNNENVLLSETKVQPEYVQNMDNVSTNHTEPISQPMINSNENFQQNLSPTSRTQFTPPTRKNSDIHEDTSPTSRFVLNSRSEILNCLHFLLENQFYLGVLGGVLEGITNEISNDSRDVVGRNLEYHQFFKGCRLLVWYRSDVDQLKKDKLLNAIDKLIITFDGWIDDPLKLNVDSIARTSYTNESIPQFVNLLCNYKGINMDRPTFQAVVKNVYARRSPSQPSDPRLLVRPLSSLIESNITDLHPPINLDLQPRENCDLQPPGNHDLLPLKNQDVMLPRNHDLTPPRNHDLPSSSVSTDPNIAVKSASVEENNEMAENSSGSKEIGVEEMKKLAENIRAFDEYSQINIARLLHNNNVEHFFELEA